MIRSSLFRIMLPFRYILTVIPVCTYKIILQHRPLLNLAKNLWYWHTHPHISNETRDSLLLLLPIGRYLPEERQLPLHFHLMLRTDTYRLHLFFSSHVYEVKFLGQKQNILLEYLTFPKKNNFFSNLHSSFVPKYKYFF